MPGGSACCPGAPSGAQGLLRTREVVERLKGVAPTPGQKPAILVYLGVLLQKGKLNALESAELARCSGVRHPGSPFCGYVFLTVFLTREGQHGGLPSH